MVHALRTIKKYCGMIFLLYVGTLPNLLWGGNIQFDLNGTLTNNRPFTAIFGDLIADDRTDYISDMYQYPILSFMQTETILEGGGNIAFINGALQLSTGNNAGGAALATSNKAVRYKPGHSTYCFFTAAFSAPNSLSQQYIGFFDPTNQFDGFSVGYSFNTVFSIIWTTGLPGGETVIPQTSFNHDKLNGTGPSGFVLNPLNFNLYRISFGWLGAAIVKFDVMDQNGNWILFHIINIPNNYQVPSVLSPNLTMGAIVTNDGNTNNTTLTTGGWNSGIIGTESNEKVSRYFSLTSGPITLTNAATDYNCISLLNVQPAPNGNANRVLARISAVNGAITSSTAPGLVIYKIIFGATISGGTYTYVDPVNSVIQYNTTGTYTQGTGTVLMEFPSAGGPVTFGKGIPLIYADEDNQLYMYFTPDESFPITITAQRLAGVSSTTQVYVSWEEQF